MFFKKINEEKKEKEKERSTGGIDMLDLISDLESNNK